MSDADLHRSLLALAGHVPAAWLEITRETLAAGDTARVNEMVAALTSGRPPSGSRYEFIPHAEDPKERATDERRDRALVASVAAAVGPMACWATTATTKDGTDRVYLVQADHGADLPALSVAMRRTALGFGGSPQVEVFGPATPLPAFHERALRAASLLWTTTPTAPVRVARTFDGVCAEGPCFAAEHGLVEDLGQRQRLLDFLAGGEVVLAAERWLPDVVTEAPGAVPASLRSDGTWVWSEASRYYLDRHRLAPDPDLAEHARARAPGGRLSPLDRYRVYAALIPTQKEAPLWRTG
jgi:hypothetical protein